jgi:cation:H+ antiporter
MPDVLLIAGGLAVLIVGAEFLVRGGTGLAAWLGIRPMVIGATVVSLGTSVPELAIGIDAALTGSPDLAVGNIVGTNLVNILLILGLSALLVPAAFRRRTSARKPGHRDRQSPLLEHLDVIRSAGFADGRRD